MKYDENRFKAWLTRGHFIRKMTYLLVLTAIVCGVMTIVALTSGLKFFSIDNTRIVLTLLYIDFVVAALLGVAIGYRLLFLWNEHKKGRAGSGLHIRIVLLFSAIAAIPAVLVSVLSLLFLSLGLEAWFSQRVSTALEQSRVVADAYLEEHRQTFRADAYDIAQYLNVNALVLSGNSTLVENLLSTKAEEHALSEALVVDGQRNVLATSEFSLGLSGQEIIPQNAIDLAATGEVALLSKGDDNRARAVIRLDGYIDAYLIIGRYLDSRVIEHLVNINQAVSQYQSMESKRKGIEITFGLIFVVATILLVLVAIWTGLTLATELTDPIANLIAASKSVRNGHLDTRVCMPKADNELAALSRSFNLMTQKLETQQVGLIEANRELDQRRHFTETVLAGVSAGVIGLDSKGAIHLPNLSSIDLLGSDISVHIGEYLGAVVPEMKELLADALKKPQERQVGEIKLARQGKIRTLNVRIASEMQGKKPIGFVVTFDDITELMAAQRKAAWADVARHVAHEIKNPLTPIQLSAERLKRKYQKEITTNPTAFSMCIDTIIRHVGDIGRMIDEFFSFARMPRPNMELRDLEFICRQVVFLERNRYEKIKFEMGCSGDKFEFFCDGDQIMRALTNLVKNAAESVVESRSDDHGEKIGGRIWLRLEKIEENKKKVVSIIIEDNGKGFPEENQDLLIEPYITGREKGTGLGLAIADKIIKDHNGELFFSNREGGGARVIIKLPVNVKNAIDYQDNRIEKKIMGIKGR